MFGEIKTACKFVVKYTYSVPLPPSVRCIHFNTDSTPTFQAIMKFIVCAREFPDWSRIAINLGVEASVINTTERNHRNCILAFKAIFEQWLSEVPGTGEKDRTWRTVLSAVEDAGYKDFVQRLKTELF